MSCQYVVVNNFFSFSVWILIACEHNLMIETIGICWALQIIKRLLSICGGLDLSSYFQCVDVLPVNRIKSRNNWNCWALNHQAIPLNMWWSNGLFVSVCESIRVWTELNLETNGTVEHLIIKRFLSICGGLFLFFQCVDAFACEQNLIKKQLELLSIEIFKCYPVIMWRSYSLCNTVCGCMPFLWTFYNFNQETIGTLLNILIHQSISCQYVVVLYSFYFSVWMPIPKTCYFAN